jgi:hypothetical protein
MEFPQLTGSNSRISESQRRSRYIRRAHANLKRKLLREMLMIVGRKTKAFTQPIPARLPKSPSSSELANYW